MYWRLLLLVCFFTFTIYNGSAQIYTFPSRTKLGVASSAPQIEGGWDADGRGESFWDKLLHDDPSLVTDGSNMDVSCDSYHLYERDLEMLSELEVEIYRFSISWSRILPTGLANKVNQAGIDYYNKIIDGLLARNITPLVTLYHWDLPQYLHELGGWANPRIADYYAEYANVVFKAFGDRVKNWLTINEPFRICYGYGRLSLAPMLNKSGIADYLCGHTVLMAHARAYHLYDEVYRKQHEDAQIGIVLDQTWMEPETDSEEDKGAVNKLIEFGLGWFANPIFSEKGNYPSILIETIAKKSLEQGFPESRLPKLSAEEIEYLKGTSDFFSLNHYSTRMARARRSDDDTYNVPSHDDDIDAVTYFDDSWPETASPLFRVVPWGFRKLLKYVKDTYNSPSVMITENGFPNNGGLEDDDRIFYLTSYLSALLEAINEDGVDVIAYTVWSLMDSFEWDIGGFSHHYGLYEVDFTSTNKTRVMRNSAHLYRDIIRRRAVLGDNQ